MLSPLIKASGLISWKGPKRAIRYIAYARLGQGLGQGPGKVGARSGQGWTKSKVRARSGQARSGQGWGKVRS